VTRPEEPQITVCGLSEDVPPEVLRALADIGRAAAEAFGEPGDPVTIVFEDGPCGCEEEP
jgi:hypothetical protein